MAVVIHCNLCNTILAHLRIALSKVWLIHTAICHAGGVPGRLVEKDRANLDLARNRGPYLYMTQRPGMRRIEMPARSEQPPPMPSLPNMALPKSFEDISESTICMLDQQERRPLHTHERSLRLRRRCPHLYNGSAMTGLNTAKRTSRVGGSQICDRAQEEEPATRQRQEKWQGINGLNARTIKGAADDRDDPVHTGPRCPAEEQERYRDEGRSKHSDEDAVFGRLLAAGLESRNEVVLQPPGVDAEAENHADG
jgi:hypothetical protein